MKKLTKKEMAWIDEVQSVLDRCPSPKKIGFYTTGYQEISLFDLRRIQEIEEHMDRRFAQDWSPAVYDLDAGFEESLIFPSDVLSTAG